MLTYEQAAALLEKHGQSHLLRWYHELSEPEQAALLARIETLDFSLLDLIEYRGQPVTKGKLEPLSALTVDEINARAGLYEAAGCEALRSGKVAAVLLAGGQGTRLGSDRPKGTVDIGLTHPLYIFQCLFNNLMDVVHRAGVWVPLLIMTSDKNNADTVAFFEEMNYFGYDRSYIRFFIQDMAPSADYDGRIFLEDKGTISLSPNGNGGWFSSIANAGLIPWLEERGVEWLNVFAVDNVLQRIADPTFVGATILSGCDSGAKVVRKADPMEKVGVLCLEDGRPSIVEYYEMTDDMIHLRDEKGELQYNFGVILNYLFSLSRLREILGDSMPVHVVEKKIPHIDENGQFIKPESPNGLKFETLVLDMVHRMKNCLSFEVVREKEFAPIKNKTGVDSIESARALLEQNGVTL